MLELFRRIYGDVPPDSTPWIQQTIDQLVDGLAKTFTTELEEQRNRFKVPTAGASEKIGRVAAEIKRDLDIELTTIRLRAGHRPTVVGDILGDFLGASARG